MLSSGQSGISRLEGAEEDAGPEVAVDEAWDVEMVLIPGANVTLIDTAAMTNRECEKPTITNA